VKSEVGKISISKISCKLTLFTPQKSQIPCKVVLVQYTCHLRLGVNNQPCNTTPSITLFKMWIVSISTLLFGEQSLFTMKEANCFYHYCPFPLNVGIQACIIKTHILTQIPFFFGGAGFYEKLDHTVFSFTDLLFLYIKPEARLWLILVLSMILRKERSCDRREEFC